MLSLQTGREIRVLEEIAEASSPGGESEEDG